MRPQGHKSDQRQGDSGQRAQQPGPRHPTPNLPSQRRQQGLEGPDQQQDDRAYVPAEDHRLSVVQPVAGHALIQGRQQHQRANGKRARRVQPQRHGGHVGLDRVRRARRNAIHV